MNYQEFKAKHLGHFVDVDGNGPYCTDLPKLILKECYCLGEIGPMGDAKDYISTVPNKYQGFKSIPTMENCHPGDIVVMLNAGVKLKNGTLSGHIGIFDSYAEDGYINVLEQNGVGHQKKTEAERRRGLPGNEIRVHKYKISSRNYHITNKQERKKYDFPLQMSKLQEVLNMNSDVRNNTQDKNLKDTLHAMSEEIRELMKKYA